MNTAGRASAPFLLIASIALIRFDITADRASMGSDPRRAALLQIAAEEEKLRGSNYAVRCPPSGDDYPSSVKRRLLPILITLCMESLDADGIVATDLLGRGASPPPSCFAATDNVNGEKLGTARGESLPPAQGYFTCSLRLLCESFLLVGA